MKTVFSLVFGVITTLLIIMILTNFQNELLHYYLDYFVNTKYYYWAQIALCVVWSLLAAGAYGMICFKIFQKKVKNKNKETNLPNN